MVNGYQKRTDSRNAIMYKKTHRNGEYTEVRAHRQSGSNYHLNASDYSTSGKRIGVVTIGQASSRDEAKRKLRSWMQSHPKGAKPGGMAGIESGASGFGASGGGMNIENPLDDLPDWMK